MSAGRVVVGCLLSEKFARKLSRMPRSSQGGALVFTRLLVRTMLEPLMQPSAESVVSLETKGRGGNCWI